ncbi:MAG: DNA mismatch repair endonuclease MutL [Paludibacteraceae bacterium]|nr:DNA mismatch repair endonuclease MutL [Paludibacteraceae bacterium]
MDIIHLLPDSVANQIAAGEVIQRPASCLKELVENSLDAGAKRIQVIVRDAGRTLLQVIDDGKGMSEMDARMAFERHATSKISQAQDLFSLRTMGFRGEALASICAVAQVELQTRRPEDEVGTLIEIHGSELVRSEMCSCPVGTNIKVSNLFFNVPVRRKFLKTDQTELRNLLTEFYHIVLVYPKVSFTFVHNDEILLELPPGTEKQRIEAVFGNPKRNVYTSGFVDVNTDTELVSIRGFVIKPESATRKAEQYFFVNGRYMRHPYFLKAVQTAYSGMLSSDYQPSFFIYFDINPEAIDVNIHPTKTEIKFADEQTIFQILMASVREALGKFTLAPQIDFDTNGSIDIPISHDGPVRPPQVTVDPTYNPFHTRSSHTVQQTAVPQWETLYPSVSGRSNEIYPDRLPSSIIPAETGPHIPVFDAETCPLWQYGGKYILAATPEGLLLINRHRAHVVVLYQQFMTMLSQDQCAMQQLLFPEVLSLQPDEMVLMSQLLPDLKAIGFEVEQLTPDSYSIQGVPAQLANQSPIPVLQYILSQVREREANTQSEWREQIALTLAENAAVPYGRDLTAEEMREIVQRMAQLPQFARTPDGKTIVSLMTDDEINKRF